MRAFLHKLGYVLAYLKVLSTALHSKQVGVPHVLAYPVLPWNNLKE